MAPGREAALVSGQIERASGRAIAHAADVLRGGGLVAFPTETVYGLGADARNGTGVARIFAAKGRPAGHPLIVHLASARDLDAWASHVPHAARLLADAFWPGPLTLIVPRRGDVPDAVTGGQHTVGLRVPSHPVARELLEAFGAGIAAPSANRFGRISPTTAMHVADDLGDGVDLIIDGGACPVGIESTIVACIGEPMLLRPGGIAVADLARVLGRALRAADAHAPRASGTLASHYAPRTPSTLVQPADLPDAVGGDVAVLARTVGVPRGFAGRWITAPSLPDAYAHDLYASLRALDRAGAARIVIEAPPDTAAWLPVRDRLLRATHAPDPRDADVD